MPPPRTGTARIKGHVVDGATGAAVARARLTLQGALRSSTTTDASGTFAFAGLPPGAIVLSVDKPTYLTTRYPPPGRTIRSNSQPLVIADGQAIENISIPLFHGAAISGRVLDANGDPLDNAQVSVLRVPSSGRIGRTTMRSSMSTDDRGEFRVGRLEPGTYILQAIYRRPGYQSEDMMPGAMSVPVVPQPLPTYYPSALAIEQAQPVTVERGQNVGDLDLVLTEGFPGVVNGLVTNLSGAPLTDMNIYVNLRRATADGPGMNDGYSLGTGARPDGTFRLTVPPGDYQLEAHATPRNMSGPMRPEEEQMGTVKVTVASGGEDSVTIGVGRGAIASGRIVFEGTTPPPPSPGKTRAPLFSNNGMCRSAEAVVAPDWTFRIEGLFGTCSPPPYASFGRWMLKSVVINGENAADAPITFQTGQQFRNVQVIVSDRPATMTFRVSDESGQATRDYVVLAYPVEKGRWETGARTFVLPPANLAALVRPPQLANMPSPAAAMPLRSPAMSGLRPGEYFVVAVDDMESEDSRDPVVLEKLRPSASRVTLSDGANIEVPLRRVTFADVLGQR